MGVDDHTIAEKVAVLSFCVVARPSFHECIGHGGGRRAELDGEAQERGRVLTISGVKLKKGDLKYSSLCASDKVRIGSRDTRRV